MNDRVAPDPCTIPLDRIGVSDPELYRSNRMWSSFARLRHEDPVHCCANSAYGPFWSVTGYKDIMHVESNHDVFSSDVAYGGVTLREGNAGLMLPMSIAMDPPKHDVQRKVVSPVVAPSNLAKLDATIRERAGKIFDSLPRNEPFNWVDRVSIELTTRNSISAGRTRPSRPLANRSWSSPTSSRASRNCRR
ncbi:MAG: cytochrome P450 [Parvibaculum sp.]|nr:cytochrome P450 [Parvibaculum sp.]